MNARQRSLIWVPIAIVTLVLANLIIQIDPNSFAFRMVAMSLIFELGFNVRKHYKELGKMESTGKA